MRFLSALGIQLSWTVNPEVAGSSPVEPAILLSRIHSLLSTAASPLALLCGNTAQIVRIGRQAGLGTLESGPHVSRADRCDEDQITDLGAGPGLDQAGLFAAAVSTSAHVRDRISFHRHPLR